LKQKTLQLLFAPKNKTPMKKPLSLLFLLSLFAQLSMAQKETNNLDKEKKNSLSIGSNYFRFLNVAFQGMLPFPVTQFSYTRQLNPHFAIKANYAFWRKDLTKSSRFSGVNYASVFNINIPIDQETGIRKFKYYDIALQYRAQLNAKHSVGLALGPSYTTYLSEYIESRSFIVQPDGSVHIIQVTSNARAKEALGAIMATEYNYSFWQNRISAGADLMGRYYPNKVPFHLIYGVHIGYNF
jgi:hypothetical protein